MASVGMIHLACYCGAELFCLGELPRDVSRGAIVDALQDQIGPADIGILTPADGRHGECPYCGLIYELPDPRLVNSLPYVSQIQIRSSLSGFQQKLAGTSDARAEPSTVGRYVN